MITVFISILFHFLSSLVLIILLRFIPSLLLYYRYHSQQRRMRCVMVLLGISIAIFIKMFIYRYILQHLVMVCLVGFLFIFQSTNHFSFEKIKLLRKLCGDDCHVGCISRFHCRSCPYHLLFRWLRLNHSCIHW